MNTEATADLIMSARHSDTFTKEACVKILEDFVLSISASRTATGVASETERIALKRLSAAQPKPESWQEIAREAAGRLWYYESSDREQMNYEIILAAIERSHADFPVQVAEPLDGASADHAIPEGRTGGSNPPTGVCPDCKQELSGDEMLDREIHGRCQSQDETALRYIREAERKDPSQCGQTDALALVKALKHSRV